MLNFNEKYICAYNEHTNKHYITSIDIEPYTLTFARFLYSYPHVNRVTIPQIQVQNDELPRSLSGIERKFDQLIRVVNFKEVFEKLGISIQLCISKQLYMPELDKYCSFQQLSDIANCVPLDYLQMSVILLKFRHAHTIFFSQIDQGENFVGQINENINQDYLIPSQDVKERDRSRTIGEVIQHVKKWRHLGEEGLNGVKLNLQQAASYVGIPKKSLDDYFYQLRVGEKYNFDFDQNAGKNISYLRKFVKANVPSRHKVKKPFNDSQQKNEENLQSTRQKLPKKLKQAQKREQPKVKEEEPANQQEMKARLSDSEVSSIQHNWPNPFLVKHDLFDEEDSFFNDFKFGNDNFVEFNHLLKNQQNKIGE